MRVRCTFRLGPWLVMLMALALSGCMHVAVGVTINADGSGTYQFATGLSKQIIDSSSGQTQIAQQFLQQEQQLVQHYGGTYRVTDDGSYITKEWDHTFSNVAQLNALI